MTTTPAATVRAATSFTGSGKRNSRPITDKSYRLAHQLSPGTAGCISGEQRTPPRPAARSADEQLQRGGQPDGDDDDPEDRRRQMAGQAGADPPADEAADGEQAD